MSIHTYRDISLVYSIFREERVAPLSIKLEASQCSTVNSLSLRNHQMRNSKVVRNIKVSAAVILITSIGLLGAGALKAEKAVCTSAKCDDGNYQCIKDDERTCDCPPIGSNTDESILWLIPQL